MTELEKIISTAYTGFTFVSGDELSKVYEYEGMKLGQGVLDIMYSNDKFFKKVQDAVREDFLDMLNDKFKNIKTLQDYVNNSEV